MHYVSYLVELGEGQVARQSVAYGPDPETRPTNAFTWKIVCDAEGKIIVRAIVDGLVSLIASARWRDGSLDRRRQADEDTPNDHQWTVIEQTLRQELVRVDGLGELKQSPRAVPVNNAVEPEPPELEHEPHLVHPARRREIEQRLADRRARGAPQADPAPTGGRRKFPGEVRTSGRAALVGVLVATGLIALVVVIGVRGCHSSESPVVTGRQIAVPQRVTPRPVEPAPPSIEQRIVQATSFGEAIALVKPEMQDTTDELGGGAKLLATYASAKLRWAEVDVPPETTIGRVEKDPELERGKRMCASGELVRIERRDLERRKVYVGELRTTEGDRISFVAVGTTGELVKRSTGKLCGAVIGKAGSAVSLVGMFDLPENRNPIVEQ